MPIGMDPVIDRDSGIIRRVSILTVGEAKGHDEYVDEVSLNQVRDIIAAKKNGAKVRMDHVSSLRTVVGRIVNPVIEGGQLYGDLHLLESTEDRDFIFEVAEELPEEFGLSIVWLGETERIGGRQYIRPTDVPSVDLVDLPAANPMGLFERKIDNQEYDMDEATIKDIAKDIVTEVIEEVTYQIEEKITGLSARLEEIEVKIRGDEERKEDELEGGEGDELEGGDPDKLEEEVDVEVREREYRAVIREEVKRGLREFSKSLGVASGASSADRREQGQVKDFASLVKQYQADGVSKADAIRKAIASHPKEYQAARDANQLRIL